MSGRKNRRFFLAAILAFSLVASPIDFSFFSPIASVRGDASISGSESWSGTRVVSGSVDVLSGATLAIAAGTVVEFDNAARLSIGGTLLVEGTPEHPVIFKRKDGATMPYTVVVAGAGKATIRSADVSGGGRSGSAFIIGSASGDSGPVSRAQAFGMSFGGGFNMYSGAFSALSGGRLDIARSHFHDNALAIHADRNSYANVKVRQSVFSDNALDFVNDGGGGPSDLRENWWGSEDGPETCLDDCAYGQDYRTIIGTTAVDPWLHRSPDIFCENGCSSSVFFLPGIKASRLYMEDGNGGEDQLWIPNYFGDDLSDLSLDEDGRSRKPVYTRDVIEDVGILGVGGNLYESFLNDLADLKADGTIADYRSFAYDWRQNVEDIAKGGTPYPDDPVHSAIADLQSLADTSNDGRVTIVAHSNGGLLAKAIMLELEKAGNASLVDKLVLVGTPQMGTPLATLSLLYGYEESALLGTLISRKESRTLVETMPGAYGLLPSKMFFDRMEESFITFTSKRTRYKAFLDAYGEGIGDADEFRRFLSGESDGRSEPDDGDVETENTLRNALLRAAQETHDRLDAWVPPPDTEVIQIAGWGLDTVSGVKYTEKEKAKCHSSGGKVPSCTGTGEYEPVYEPVFTVDGDEVVVASSALMLPEADNVKRYWVNLYSYNDPFTTIDRKHKNIFEVDPIRDFLSQVIQNENISLSSFISNIRPSDYEGASPRLRMSLYSPLDIHLYDSLGNHTGPKTVTIGGEEHRIFETGIPNSAYYQFGERKYVSFGSGSDIRVEMDGYASGSYSLTLEEVRPTATGEDRLARVAFANLPTTADTVVSFTVPGAGLSGMSALSADIDGDGADDYAIMPVLDGEATLSGSIVSPALSSASPVDTQDDGGKKNRTGKKTRAAVASVPASREEGVGMSGKLFPDIETNEAPWKRDSDTKEAAQEYPAVAGESDAAEAKSLSKLLLGIGLVPVLVAVGWFGYRTFVKRRKKL